MIVDIFCIFATTLLKCHVSLKMCSDMSLQNLTLLAPSRMTDIPMLVWRRLGRESHYMIRRLLNACSWRFESRKFKSIVMNMATVDAHGMILYIFRHCLCACPYGQVQTDGAGIVYIHRRGFRVARSTILGNARASKRGTGNRYGSHAFFVW